MGFIALGAASGLLSGLLNRGQAQAQTMVQQMQQDQANFQRQMQVDVQNRNLIRQYEATRRSSLLEERAAVEDREISRIYSDLAYDNQRSQLSKQTNQVNGALASSLQGRGIAGGTARALLRQQQHNAQASAVGLAFNNLVVNKDIDKRFEARINAIPEDRGVFTQAFVPNTTAVVDNSSSVFTQSLISGLLQGVQGQIANG